MNRPTQGAPRARGWLRLVHRTEDSALVAGMAALVTLSLGQIVLRTCFGVALSWSEPLVRHLVLWCGLLGALMATREDRHIRLDAALRLTRGRLRRLLEGAAAGSSAAVCLILGVIAVLFLRDEHAYGARPFLGIPSWTLQLIFPLAFGGMGLRFVARCVRALQRPPEDAA